MGDVRPVSPGLGPGQRALLNGLCFTRTVAAYLFFYKFPLLLAERGFSGLLIGQLIALPPISALLATFWLGWLSDRLDARHVIAAGLVGQCLFLNGLASAESPTVFALLFVLLGATNQAHSIGTNAYLFKGIGSGKKESGAIARFSAAGTLGICVGLLAGPGLVARNGLGAPLRWASLLPVALLALLPLLPAARTRGAPSPGRYFALLRRPQVALFMGLIFLFTLHWGTEGTCHSPFLVHVLAIPEGDLGFFLGLPILALSLSSLLFGWLGARRLGGRGILGAAFLFSGGGAIAFASCRSVPWAFFWRCVHEFGDGAFMFFMLYGIHLLFEKDLAGGCSSLVWLTAMAASATAAQISAPWAQASGFHVPQIAAGVLALLSLAGTPFLRPGGEEELAAAPLLETPRA